MADQLHPQDDILVCEAGTKKKRADEQPKKKKKEEERGKNFDGN